MHAHEMYWCLDCESVVALNPHLRCATCNSESVVSEHVANLQAAHEKKVAEAVA